MSAATAVLLVHAGCTVAMAGLIAFVQIVHYPLFAEVGPTAFARYAEAHNRRTTWVVMPLMLAEMATALWLVVLAMGPAPPPGLAWAAWPGIALLAVAWLSTFLLQVPCHDRLQRGFDRAVWQRLVTSNWLRTIAWTTRAVLSLWLLAPPGTGP